MKWIVLILVVGGLVLAAGPALAQGIGPPGPPQNISPGPPSQSMVPCVSELARYHHLILQYNKRAQAYFEATGGDSPFPGHRGYLRQIAVRQAAVDACQQANAKAQSGGQNPPPGR